MIHKIKINNNKNTHIKYLEKLECFANGVEYNFTPGINIIVGDNGCGKTTLMNLINDFMLCNNGISSEIPKNALDFPQFWAKSDTNDIPDGISVCSDYKYILFRSQQRSEITHHNEMMFAHSENLLNFMTSSSLSTGETVKQNVNFVLNRMFSEDYQDKIKFNFVEKLEDFCGSINSVWTERIKSLINYYKNNTITNEVKKVTLMLDEPDRNLDINNIKELYGLLTYEHPQVQLIVVLHNSSLIYKLSKLDYINFVEMTDGYINKIVNFIENEN